MKRANGEGCISRYGNKWRGRFTDPISRKQRSVYGDTQKECKSKLDAALEAIRAGKYVEPTVDTTGSWLDTWFSSYYCIGTKQSTQASTHNDIKVLKGYIGSIPLQKLNTEHIQSMIQKMGEANYAASTINRKVKVLKQALNKAVKRKKIRENPVCDCTLPQNVKPEIAFLTESEQTALLAVLPDTTHGRAIKFLLGTGMRVSELCGLKWADFQTDGIHIDRVNMTVQDWRDDGYINVETLPKTTRGKRVVPLTKTLISILNRQSTAQKKDCLKTGRKYDEKNGYIFANTLGNPADRHNIARAYRSLCKKAGIEPRGIHTLRHTFATNWVRNSPDVPTLSRILGHADAAFTYKTYCHTDPESMKQGMDMMESFISAVNE